MIHPRILFNWLVPPLRDYEMAILDAVCHSLNEPHRLMLSRRIQHINLVQRQDGGRLVQLYYMKRGRVEFCENERLPTSKEEQRLATVSLDFSEPNSEIVCDLWLVHGFLSSIEFRDSPEAFGEHGSARIQKIALEII